MNAIVLAGGKFIIAVVALSLVAADGALQVEPEHILLSSLPAVVRIVEDLPRFSVRDLPHSLALQSSAASAAASGAGACTFLDEHSLECTLTWTGGAGSVFAVLNDGAGEQVAIFVLYIYDQPVVSSLAPPSLPLEGGQLVNMTFARSLSQFGAVVMRLAVGGSVTRETALEVQAGGLAAVGRTQPIDAEIGAVGETAEVHLALNGRDFVATGMSVTLLSRPKKKVGFVLAGSPQDLGWNLQHNVARLAIEERFVDRVETVYREQVSEWGPNVCDFCSGLSGWNASRGTWGDDPPEYFGSHESAVVMRDWIENEGVGMIITTSYYFHWDTYHMAEAYPEVHFVHASGWLTRPNMAVCFPKVYQARYLSGIALGWYLKASGKPKRVGFASSFKLAETVRHINAFKLGLEAVDPEIEIYLTWLYTWNGVRQERIGTLRLLEFYGVEAIAQHTNDPEPQLVAREHGKVGVGYNADMHLTVGDSVLTAPILVWSEDYASLVQKALDDDFETFQSNLWTGADVGSWRLQPLSPLVPLQAKLQIEEEQQRFLNGEDDIFCRPGLTDNRGRPINDASQAANLVPGTTCLTEFALSQHCLAFSGFECTDHWLLAGVHDTCAPTPAAPDGIQSPDLPDDVCFLGSLDLPEQCAEGTWLGIMGCMVASVGTFAQNEEQINCTRGYNAPQAGLAACLPCQAGKAANAEGMAACEACAPGAFTDEAGSTECRQCEAGRFSNTLGLSICEYCPMGTYAPEAGSSACRVCGALETTPYRGAAERSSCRCIGGTFLDPARGICSSCPVHMTCEGGLEEPLVNAKYWADVPSPDGSYVVFQCGDVQACPGGQVGDLCGPAHVGFLCELCEDQFHRRWQQSSCEPCQGGDSVPFVLATIGFFLSPLVVHAMLNSHVSRGRRKQSNALFFMALMGQVITYSQILTMVGSFNIEWPSTIRALLNVLSIFMLQISILVPACTVGEWGFRQEFPLSCMGPLMFAGLYSAYYGLSVVANNATHGRVKRLNWYVMANTCGRIFLVFHVWILTNATKYFECYWHPNEKDQSLVAFPNILCWSSSHLEMMPVALFSLSLYCIVIFAGLLWVVKSAPRFVGEKWFVQTCGFLMLKFRPDRWYWSVVIFIRNTTLAFVITLFPNHPIIQAVMFSLTLLVFICLNAAFMPWNDPSNNLAELTLTALIIIFALAALPLAPKSDAATPSLTAIMVTACTFAACVLIFLAGCALLKAMRGLRERLSFQSNGGQASLSSAGFSHGVVAVMPLGPKKAESMGAEASIVGVKTEAELQKVHQFIGQRLQDAAVHLAQFHVGKLVDMISHMNVYDKQAVQRFLRLIAAECAADGASTAGEGLFFQRRLASPREDQISRPGLPPLKTLMPEAPTAAQGIPAGDLSTAKVPQPDATPVVLGLPNSLEDPPGACCAP